MTDNEIIKALECCGIKHCCEECPYKGVKCKLMNGVLSDALDLINRQQAEIERLQKLLEGWKTEAYKVAYEKDELYCAAVERVKTIKAEAVKEFAERLKKEYTETFLVSGDTVIEILDNLVKETEGDAE